MLDRGRGAPAIRRRSAHPHSSWTFVFALIVLATTALAPAARAEEAFLGVQLQELDDALMRALDLPEDGAGVLVAQVLEDTPAAQAGLEEGDVIVAVDGRTIRSVRALRRRIARHDPGEKVEIEILRRGHEKKLEVELGAHADREDREDEEENTFLFGPGTRGIRRFFIGAGGPRLGVEVESLDEKLGRYFGTDSGVLVLKVEEDSPAAEAGIERGDVIVGIDGEPVESHEDLVETLEDHEGGDEVAVEILRDRKTRELTATLEEDEGLEFSFGPRHFRWLRGAERAPRHEGWHQGELRRELDELREELRQLRKQLREGLKGANEGE